MSDEALLLEKEGAVARLVLNRPADMNSLNLAMVSLFEKYLPDIAADDSIRVVILTGNGRAFCAGADL